MRPRGLRNNGDLWEVIHDLMREEHTPPDAMLWTKAHLNRRQAEAIGYDFERWTANRVADHFATQAQQLHPVEVRAYAEAALMRYKAYAKLVTGVQLQHVNVLVAASTAHKALQRATTPQTFARLAVPRAEQRAIREAPQGPTLAQGVRRYNFIAPVHRT